MIREEYHEGDELRREGFEAIVQFHFLEPEPEEMFPEEVEPAEEKQLEPNSDDTQI